MYYFHRDSQVCFHSQVFNLKRFLTKQFPKWQMDQSCWFSSLSYSFGFSIVTHSIIHLNMDICTSLKESARCRRLTLLWVFLYGHNLLPMYFSRGFYFRLSGQSFDCIHFQTLIRSRIYSVHLGRILSKIYTLVNTKTVSLFVGIAGLEISH